MLDNYGYEAAREAIDARRSLLAAAGSVCSALTIAQMARVERALRELDPNFCDDSTSSLKAVDRRS